MTKSTRHTLYGSRGSGSAAVEIALARCGVPFRIVRASSWEPDSALGELAKVNPLRQVPTLVLPGGTVLSESAAILIHLGLAHRAAELLPRDAVARAKAIRGLVFIAANCYSALGINDPSGPLDDRDDEAGARAGAAGCTPTAASQLGDLRRHIRCAAIPRREIARRARHPCRGGIEVGRHARSPRGIQRPRFLRDDRRIEAHEWVAPVFRRALGRLSKSETHDD
jgi:GST-like protein